MKYFARSALSLGLFAVFSTSGFASGLVLADNEFRNDLTWNPLFKFVHLAVERRRD